MGVLAVSAAICEGRLSLAASFISAFVFRAALARYGFARREDEKRGALKQNSASVVVK
jgi:hypothetical protein